MMLGRVIGRVWATVKSHGLDGQRLLFVQPLTPELQPTGRRMICTDSMGCGAGELVYWVRGKEASMPFLPSEVPTDCTIVGIVDEVHVPSKPARPAPRRSRSRPPAGEPPC